MPVQNGLGSFSVGRDCQLVVIGPTGQRIDLQHVTDFHSEQMTADVQVDRLDGLNLFGYLPKGWRLSFTIDRGNSAADDLIAAIEQTWYSAGSTGTGTIYQYVQEADGSQSTYQFSGVPLKLADAGQWKGDSTVKQRIDGVASLRTRV